ncbi:MAG: PQQ-dependent sugar dehydrogenase [Acidobacteriota bacterium]|nr:PQQ-dependent sugar dehydrogenase [Acidobacteriota bacterium]
MFFLVSAFIFMGPPTCNLEYGSWPGTYDILDLSDCITSAGLDCFTPDAGDNQVADVGLTVDLDASGTQVPSAPEELVFQWSQTAGPEAVELLNANTVMASFSAQSPGLYSFEVEITWFCRTASATVDITVNAALAAPNALNAELFAENPCSLFPIQVTHAGPGDDRLFIVCKEGRIMIYKNGAVLPEPFLDIQDLVLVSQFNFSDERGLLGLAFDPDYATNGYFYVNYTGDGPDARGGVTDDTRITAFGTDPMNADLADLTQNALLLTVTQPQSNHNGGQIFFGPDGYLYIGTGDGGGANDLGSGHDPVCGNGQYGETLLGKMLRIQVDGLSPYSIPPDNPFIDDPGVLDEIWALGLRNPWRWSFDRATGDMYIADVGQGTWEEIDFQPADSSGGENYGWPYKEGNAIFFNGPDGCSDPGGLSDPVFEYNHTDNARAVTGGFVYRGQDIPNLYGFYIFADYNASGFPSSGKRYFSLVQRSGGIWEGNPLDVYVDDSPLAAFVAAFGEDHRGELYIVTTGDIYKITGIRN